MCNFKAEPQKVSFSLKNRGIRHGKITRHSKYRVRMITGIALNSSGVSSSPDCAAVCRVLRADRTATASRHS